MRILYYKYWQKLFCHFVANISNVKYYNIYAIYYNITITIFIYRSTIFMQHWSFIANVSKSFQNVSKIKSIFLYVILLRIFQTSSKYYNEYRKYFRWMQHFRNIDPKCSQWTNTGLPLGIPILCIHNIRNPPINFYKMEFTILLQ